jgi:hypothetical protein
MWAGLVCCYKTKGQKPLNSDLFYLFCPHLTRASVHCRQKHQLVTRRRTHGPRTVSRCPHPAPACARIRSGAREYNVLLLLQSHIVYSSDVVPRNSEVNLKLYCKRTGHHTHRDSRCIRLRNPRPPASFLASHRFCTGSCWTDAGKSKCMSH